MRKVDNLCSSKQRFEPRGFSDKFSGSSSTIVFRASCRSRVRFEGRLAMKACIKFARRYSIGTLMFAFSLSAIAVGGDQTVNLYRA